MASLHLYGSSKLPQIVQIFLRLTISLHSSSAEATPVTLDPWAKNVLLRRVTRTAAQPKAAPRSPCPRGDPHAELDNKILTVSTSLRLASFVFVLTTLPDLILADGGRAARPCHLWLSFDFFSLPFILLCSHSVQKENLYFFLRICLVDCQPSHSF